VRQTYPDLRLEIHDQWCEDEVVVTTATARGTHSGRWLGLEPTGKTVEIFVVDLDRVRGGKIVEHWGAANTLEALLEIGALTID